MSDVRVLVHQRGVAGPNSWLATLHVYEVTPKRRWFKPETKAYGATCEQALGALRAADTRAVLPEPEVSRLVTAKPRPERGGVEFVYDDGGREAAGFRGHAGDCVTRAITIATGLPYQQVYDELFEGAREYRATTRGRKGARDASPRNGVYPEVYKPYLARLGWVWTPTMQLGSGTKVHVDADELPGGTLILRLSKHLAAVIDGVLHDTNGCSRGGERAAYGYWSAP